MGPNGDDAIAARHRAFSTPIEMIEFIAQLRKLSGGKPVGFKLCLGHPWEFMGIVKAMRETGIVPDFIVVDGAEGGTGASPLEFSDHIGVPLREGLLFAHNALVGAGVRDAQVGAAGRSSAPSNCAAALGDWTTPARVMFAIGCIHP